MTWLRVWIWGGIGAAIGGGAVFTLFACVGFSDDGFMTGMLILFVSFVGALVAGVIAGIRESWLFWGVPVAQLGCLTFAGGALAGMALGDGLFGPSPLEIPCGLVGGVLAALGLPLILRWTLKGAPEESEKADEP